MIKRNISTSTGKWAESEFGIVNFGDIRLSKRLLKTVLLNRLNGECKINHRRQVKEIKV
ncbi:transposase Tn5 [Wolbachia endosymbiont of Armadillidium vulgare str. wVulC]|uniref:Transposase DNA-binding-containing protein n=1 Tax=Wolbachia endosymbiont of Armadillidium arcangelii TaxID=3158571 RepID=A0AAU7Q3I8_9RICK|nr:transposase DNA-binding-containing protein [Wolbachia endosymbiont of Armadillidium vulgare]KLT23448.1 transposase Tn5 [Wolbachia endosymbiont of Armadillidium vulgare str. wVulC]